jgi:hypothetical protein
MGEMTSDQAIAQIGALGLALAPGRAWCRGALSRAIPALPGKPRNKRKLPPSPAGRGVGVR